MEVAFDILKKEFKRVLLALSFTDSKAGMCAEIFAGNSRDGVYSHGLNRFPVFVEYIKEGLIKPEAEPTLTTESGVLQQWNGNLAPGMYTATLATNRAIELARQYGMGCVSVANTNHWMRGGTYGWQAADANCIAICATNTIAVMPPWGGTQPKLGNNPLIIAVPRKEGHLVLDMAMSQFSYGKLQEYELKGEQLPVTGGYDEEGNLTNDPSKISRSKRALPIGFWKGSGLSFMLDVMVSALSGGRSTAQISAGGKEYGVSQFFMCIDVEKTESETVDEMIAFTKGESQNVRYPGEKTLSTRQKNLQEGIPVNEKIWEQVLKM